jgi:hypothetical protein
MRDLVTSRPTAQTVILALVALWLWVVAILPAWANVAWGELRQDYPGGPWYCHYQGECNEETGEGCPDPADPNICWL